MTPIRKVPPQVVHKPVPLIGPGPIEMQREAQRYKNAIMLRCMDYAPMHAMLTEKIK